MAKRRCISVEIFESDAYLSLSKQAQILYIYLMCRSDDEGVVSNPYYITRMLGFGKDRLTELENRDFIIRIDDVYVIRHWYIHNKISPSKRTPSIYQKHLSKLTLNGDNCYEVI